MFSLYDGRSVEAEGEAKGSGNEKRFVIEYAKKNAVTDARFKETVNSSFDDWRKNAFQMIAIIELENGKVAAHLLSDTSLDHWKEKEQVCFSYALLRKKKPLQLSHTSVGLGDAIQFLDPEQVKKILF